MNESIKGSFMPCSTLYFLDFALELKTIDGKKKKKAIAGKKRSSRWLKGTCWSRSPVCRSSKQHTQGWPAWGAFYYICNLPSTGACISLQPKPEQSQGCCNVCWEFLQVCQSKLLSLQSPASNMPLTFCWIPPMLLVIGGYLEAR